MAEDDGQRELGVKCGPAQARLGSGGVGWVGRCTIPIWGSSGDCYGLGSTLLVIGSQTSVLSRGPIGLIIWFC